MKWATHWVYKHTSVYPSTIRGGQRCITLRGKKTGNQLIIPGECVPGLIPEEQTIQHPHHGNHTNNHSIFYLQGTIHFPYFLCKRVIVSCVDYRSVCMGRRDTEIQATSIPHTVFIWRPRLTEGDVFVQDCAEVASKPVECCCLGHLETQLAVPLVANDNIWRKRHTPQLEPGTIMQDDLRCVTVMELGD